MFRRLKKLFHSILTPKLSELEVSYLFSRFSFLELLPNQFIKCGSTGRLHLIKMSGGLGCITLTAIWCDPSTNLFLSLNKDYLTIELNGSEDDVTFEQRDALIGLLKQLAVYFPFSKESTKIYVNS